MSATLRKALEANADKYQAAAELVAAHVRHALRRSLGMHFQVVPTRVSWRVKSPSSALRKLRSLTRNGRIRHRIRTVRDVEAVLDDLAGVRVICDYLTDVEAIRGYLHRHPTLNVLRSKTVDYIAQPKEGYRGVHLIVRVPSGFGQVKCEVQIRTMLQHAWAEKTHDLLYKLGKSDVARIPKEIRNLVKHQSDTLFSGDETALSVLKLVRRYRGADR